jgi:hypothetical protein
MARDIVYFGRGDRNTLEDCRALCLGGGDAFTCTVYGLNNDRTTCYNAVGLGGAPAPTFEQAVARNPNGEYSWYDVSCPIATEV